LFYIMMATTPSPSGEGAPRRKWRPGQYGALEQSLVFTDGGSNRSEDTIRAIREGCHSDALDGAGNPINPAGLDDPRCQFTR
jgi:hypothetical protein